MDDGIFDDLLKRKLANYEDQSIEPSTLDDFHERMSNFQPTRWYIRHAARIALAASLLMFTAINAYILVKNLHAQEQNRSVYPPYDQSNQNRVDSLLALIDRIQCRLLESPARTQYPTSSKFTLRLVKVNDGIDNWSSDGAYKIGIGARENIPENVYSKLEREGFVATENGEVFLLLSKREKSEFQDVLQIQPRDLLAALPRPGTLQVIVLGNGQAEKKRSAHTRLKGNATLATRNALEKHYFNKLGIQLGGHGDLMKEFVSQGTGTITPRIGLTADWILSPRISLETGIDYGTTEVRFTGSEIPRVPFNQQLGNLESVLFTNRFVSTPLIIKYRQWVADKTQMILRTGYTPYRSITKLAQYNYVRPEANLDDSAGDRISTIDKHDENRFFGGTIMASVGLTVNRKKNKALWEASLFFEHGVGNGFGKSNMQLVGLRTAYWLKVR